ncbi:hypothetical protein [Sphingobacterium sp. HSC-15S19]|uniref:hypothetical protein n=1 Tax=Sphingobacterium sp. HSC-15S19 TaxID=2910971 RepID=UPI003D1D8B9C
MLAWKRRSWYLDKIDKPKNIQVKIDKKKNTVQLTVKDKVDAHYNYIWLNEDGNPIRNGANLMASMYV